MIYTKWNSLMLSFHTLDMLLKKKILNYEDAYEILKNTLPPEMSKKEKDKIIENMLERSDK